MLAIGLLLVASAGAADSPSAQMQSLDEQVQAIKSDVLGIAAELSQLEEKLLYPSGTQVAVFVSLAADETSRLDAIQIQIDGESVAHHIYSHQELEALRKGGVQRVYTGNLPTGPHRLDVSISGKLAGGGDFSGTQTLPFEKAVGPEVIQLELSSDPLGQASIRLASQ